MKIVCRNIIFKSWFTISCAQISTTNWLVTWYKSIHLIWQFKVYEIENCWLHQKHAPNIYLKKLLRILELKFVTVYRTDVKCSETVDEFKRGFWRFINIIPFIMYCCRLSCKTVILLRKFRIYTICPNTWTILLSSVIQYTLGMRITIITNFSTG